MLDGQLMQRVGHLSVMNPAHLHKYWPLMRPGLERLQQVGMESDWTPEDLYCAIKNGSSVALIDAANWAGFAICTQVVDFKGPMLWIWCLYSETGYRDDDYWEQIKEYAAELGVERICFSSARPGFAKAAKEFGFRAVRIVYEMRVE